MSDLQTKVEAAFKDSSKKLGEVGNRLNDIVDLDQKLQDLSSNLGLSATNLRKLTNQHVSYLQKADELNASLAEIADTLAELNPEELDAKLKSIERECSDLRDRMRSSEVVIEKAVNRVFYLVVVGFLSMAGLIFVLLRM